jgi:S-adenosylmethionine:tRNA-ribosyltransferase-isomerase (queuine synthetase)
MRFEYQTVYSNNYGSAAAPTPDCIFEKQLGELLDHGLAVKYINLNIGLVLLPP